MATDIKWPNDPADRLPKEFVEHRVFLELESYRTFYNDLSMAVFKFVTTGTRAFHNIDTYVLSSVGGTLDSIQCILRRGRINDAYALLRKYFDSVIINVYSNLYLQSEFSLANLCVKQIDDWLKGTEQLPEYRVLSNYIRSSDKVSEINDLLYTDGRYKAIRNRCNDHTHYNFYHNVLLNDNEIHLPGRIPAVDLFSRDVRDVFVMHLAYMFFLNNHYMMSSDYVDYLECGMTPEPDSQYWVAPFVQEVFDRILCRTRPDIADTIKNHTCMQLS